MYEARDELRDEMLRWTQHFRFKQFSIFLQEMEIDTSGIHARLGVIQPDMVLTTQVASVCRSWYSSVLPTVTNKPWLSLWKAARTFSKLGTSILAQMQGPNTAPMSLEPLPRQEAPAYRNAICVHIGSAYLLPVNLIRDPLRRLTLSRGGTAC